MLETSVTFEAVAASIYELDDAAHKLARDMLYKEDARGIWIPVPYTLRRVGTVAEGESEEYYTGDMKRRWKDVKSYTRLYEVTYFEEELEQRAN